MDIIWKSLCLATKRVLSHSNNSLRLKMRISAQVCPEGKKEGRKEVEVIEVDDFDNLPVTSKWHFRTTSPINTASSAGEN